MKNLNSNKVTVGVCYYPEQWNESLWESDLERMQKAGIEVIRIAEFAWSIFEPIEGEFNFELFDRFMNLLHKTNIRVIFGTPTATPPAWASENYPEILNADKNGLLYQHGERRHYNYNSCKYRELTQRIVQKLAEHYGNDTSIIGWQIDNELNCDVDEFYSQSDNKAFRLFLQRKYNTLDRLNEVWGTVFWNQTYSDWSQVFVPRHTPKNSPNPHQVLDFIRFVSDSVCGFVNLQSNILGKYISPSQFITTNGIFGNLDSHRLVEESLDFITYDSYPDFAFCLTEDPKHSDDLNDRKWSKNLTEVRSICPNFGIMEQQSGACGWNSRMEAPMPKPGQITLWTMQSIAHGADFVSYFRWRTSVIGTEIYWHGILDYSNQDNRRLAEICDITKKVNQLSGIVGSKYKASFAIVKEYDNVWDIRYDMWHKRVELESEKGWFNAAQHTHTPMDYLYIRENTALEDIKSYPLLVYPHATILKQRTADLLKEYVSQGGTLLMGCRTGYKDETGKCRMNYMTGAAADICGVDLEDYTFLSPADEMAHIIWDDSKLDGAIFNDILKPLNDQTEVIGKYDSNYFKGRPGLTVHKIGKGKAYYFGAAFNEKSAAVFLKKFGIENPFNIIVDAPEGCELAIREKNGANYLFMLNYLNSKAKVDLKTSVLDLFTGNLVTGQILLNEFETKVFKF